MVKAPFWQTKPLSVFSEEEWESICTHCGRCCLIKLQDEESDSLCYTRIICRYFDTKTHLCREYQNRCSLVPECLKLSPKNIDSLDWMPLSCAYRILNETGDLPEGHPLKGGNNIPPLPQNLVPDNLVAEEELEDYIIEDEEI